VALVVETGLGFADADALISVADADAYHTARGNSAWTGADAVKEPAIRRATAFLSNSYRWAGGRTHGRRQALAWPRGGVVDEEGIGIESNEIPIEIMDACAEIALRELITPGAMNPDFKASELVKSEKVGQIAVEYALSSMNADGQRPVLLIVRDMITQFLAVGVGNSIVGSSFRV
jgi:hypothetical protein